jgi:hypothetical protein
MVELHHAIGIEVRNPRIELIVIVRFPIKMNLGGSAGATAGPRMLLTSVHRKCRVTA